MSYGERDRRNRLVTCVELVETAILRLEDLRAKLKTVTDTRPDYLGAAEETRAEAAGVASKLAEVGETLGGAKW